jgi:hypothetical protein
MHIRLIDYFSLILAAISLCACSPSVRSIRPDEIATSKADEILIFTSDPRVYGCSAESCYVAGTDSNRILHIQGVQFTDVSRTQSKPYGGDLHLSSIVSIDAHYRPKIYHAGPLFLVLSSGFIVFFLIRWGVRGYW